MFSAPEDKLWLVVKQYNGTLDNSPASFVDNKRGIKLEKNSVIKMGRVRLRIRDIDYPIDKNPKKMMLPELSPVKGPKQPSDSPLKTTS